MNTKSLFIVIILTCPGIFSNSQDLFVRDTVDIQSGDLSLKGLLWHPGSTGKFPAVVYCHGSYESDDTRYDAVEQVLTLGPLFAKKGYIFLGVFRRGTGLSKGQGENVADLMKVALREKGQDARNKMQLQQLETDQMQDMVAGLSFLKKREDVDSNQIIVSGHSFGGSLALLLAEHEKNLKAAVVFGAAGKSWNISPVLRDRLFKAVNNINIPVMLIYAQNDYSVSPGYAIDSVMTRLGKPHLLKIYPAFGKNQSEGHNLMFLSPETCESDVFKFLSVISN